MRSRRRARLTPAARDEQIFENFSARAAANFAQACYRCRRAKRVNAPYEPPAAPVARRGHKMEGRKCVTARPSICFFAHVTRGMGQSGFPVIPFAPANAQQERPPARPKRLIGKPLSGRT